jgi:peptidoglycan/xylan/chitin deacetylase (PgdA/CDA1 family)
LVADFINRSELNEAGELVYLSLEEIKQMDPAVVEFALHSFNHKSYNDLSIEEIDADITDSKQTLDALGIKYLPCHAYTYGAFPKRDATKRDQLNKILSKHNIEMAFRIGNRVNKLPLENPYLVQRIDVRGTDSLFQFKTKLRTGRSKLFG